MSQSSLSPLKNKTLKLGLNKLQKKISYETLCRKCHFIQSCKLVINILFRLVAQDRFEKLSDSMNWRMEMKNWKREARRE